MGYTTTTEKTTNMGHGPPGMQGMTNQRSNRNRVFKIFNWSFVTSGCVLVLHTSHRVLFSSLFFFFSCTATHQRPNTSKWYTIRWVTPQLIQNNRGHAHSIVVLVKLIIFSDFFPPSLLRADCAMCISKGPNRLSKSLTNCHIIKREIKQSNIWRREAEKAKCQIRIN